MEEEEKIRRIILADIQMPFQTMLLFMVKWAIASIPALIILWVVLAILTAVFK